PGGPPYGAAGAWGRSAGTSPAATRPRGPAQRPAGEPRVWGAVVAIVRAAGHSGAWEARNSAPGDGWCHNSVKEAARRTSVEAHDGPRGMRGAARGGAGGGERVGGGSAGAERRGQGRPTMAQETAVRPRGGSRGLVIILGALLLLGVIGWLLSGGVVVLEHRTLG